MGFLDPFSLRRAVLAVHGIGGGAGHDRAGFSDRLRRRVFSGMGDVADALWFECVWEDLNDSLDARIAEVVRIMARGPALKGLPRALPAKIVCQSLDVSLDFWFYLDSAHGARIRRRLRTRIAEASKGRPGGVVLVAHSLGSVIAYDVLSEAHRKGVRLPVAGLVTFGSPLAWTFALREADGKAECANRDIGDVPWTNIYYREDPVPLYMALPSDRFPEARNVALPLPKRATARTAHCAYWRDPALARIVRALLAGNQPFTDQTPGMQ